MAERRFSTGASLRSDNPFHSDGPLLKTGLTHLICLTVQGTRASKQLSFSTGKGITSEWISFYSQALSRSDVHIHCRGSSVMQCQCNAITAWCNTRSAGNSDCIITSYTSPLNPCCRNASNSTKAAQLDKFSERERSLNIGMRSQRSPLASSRFFGKPAVSRPNTR